MEDSENPTAQESKNRESRREHGRDLAIDALLNAVYVFSATEVEMRRERRRSFLRRWSAVAAVFLVMFAVGYFIDPQVTNDPRIIRIDSIKGSAVHGKEGAMRTSRKGGAVLVGEVMITGADCSLVLSYADGTGVYLGPDSILASVENTESILAKTLDLRAGDLKISAVKQEAQSPLRVISPEALIKVVGTVFQVSVKVGFTELSVTEGQVEIQRPDGSKSLQVYEKQIAKMGPDISTVEMNDPSAKAMITGFTLIRGRDGEVLPDYNPIANGATLSLADIPSGGVNILINTTGDIKHIIVDDSGAGGERIERVEPYSVGGDSVHLQGRHGRLRFKIGPRKITVTPFDQSGQAGEGKALTINVVE